MTYHDLLKHYGDGSLTKAARALGVPITTLSSWRRGIPFGRQCQIQIETGGILQADDAGKRKKWRYEASR